MDARVHRRLEKEARELLRLSGTATGEIRLAHKKIDLMLDGHRYGRRWRTAVECKAYARAMHMSEVAKVIAEYRPLIDGRQVEEVLLVTRSGLSPDAEALMQNERAFAHMTLTGLSNDVLDLSAYMQGLRDSYDHSPDGIAEYYVPVLVEGHTDLYEYLTDWISDGDKPIAVLGAYGTGKSTFALYFARELAQAAETDPAARRPVLIRLSDISAEQTLEGLLGRTLGVTNAIPNYAFDRFMALNRAGRFVVILDGFDEMKRTLSWEEFQHNFQQLNRLVAGESRVLLLGRPTAFLNDEEYDLALHGKQRIGDRETRLPEWPDYETVRISPFGPFQIKYFLERYLRWAAEQRDKAERRRKRPRTAAQAASHEQKLQAQISHQIRRVEEGHLQSIAERPVQLKMLAEVLPTYRGKLENLDTTLLFDHFIDRIIERDATKLTRTRFSTDERRKFASDLAWWLWSRPAKVRIAPDEIPDEIVADFAHGDERVDAVRRDLVAACFLDRTHGGPLVFPHRSFQEFLVAERGLERLRAGHLSIAELDRVLNPEVAEFLYGLTGRTDLSRIDDALGGHRGEMSMLLARLWFSDSEKATALEGLWAQNRRNPWYPQFLTWARLRVSAAVGRRRDAVRTDDLLGALGGSRDPEYALLLWRCLLSIATAQQDDHLAESATMRLMRVGPTLDPRERIPEAMSILRRANFSARKDMLDLRGTYTPMAERLRNFCWLAGASASDGLPTAPIRIASDEFSRAWANL